MYVNKSIRNLARNRQLNWRRATLVSLVLIILAHVTLVCYFHAIFQLIPIEDSKPVEAPYVLPKVREVGDGRPDDREKIRLYEFTQQLNFSIARKLLVKDRAFSAWNGSLPCFHPTGNNTMVHWTNKHLLKRPTKEGLLFLKLLKTASSTGASIHVRIARNLARRLKKDFAVCRTRHLHGSASPRMYRYGQRDRQSSFLWTLLREPTSRYISEFFHFEVSRLGVDPSDYNVIEFLRHGKHSDHHYISWLSTRRYRRNHRTMMALASMIMNDYDFIGVSERMDETVVALKMILGVPLADILNVPSKINGGYDDGQFNGTCYTIPSPIVSPGVRAYLRSADWRRYIRPETELYLAANRSLDRTIASLGPEIFHAELVRYRNAKDMVAVRCVPIVKFPCSSTGERRARNETDCLQGDIGCGFECLDQVSTELGLW